MADIEDATDALEGTNLADGGAAADVPPPGTVTLVSSDGHRFHVDRQRIDLESTVFSDMFELADSVEAGQSCDLTESKRHLDAFFAALWDGNQPNNAEEWLAVYHMGDKFDVKRVRPVLLLWAWEAIDARDDYIRTRSARDAYAVGLLLGRERLVKTAAEIALRCDDLDALGNPIFDSLNSSDQRRLRIFARARQEASHRSFTTIKFKLKSCRCMRDSGKTAYDTPQQIWDDAQRVVENSLKPHTDLPDSMRREIFRHTPRLEGCVSCWRALDDKLDLLERQWTSGKQL